MAQEGRSLESTEDPSVLQDFSGGQNSTLAPNRLPANQSPGSSNFWYDDGALTQRPGQFKTALPNSVYGRSWNGISLHTSVFSVTQNLIMGVQAGISANFLLSTSDAVSLGQMTTGAAGTATTTSAGASVTGIGSNWVSGNTAQPGGIFSIGSTVGIIQSVNSDTSITLTAPFGANNTSQPYLITAGWATSKRLSYADMNNAVWVSGQGSTPVSWNGSTQVYQGFVSIGTISASTSSTTVTGVGTNFLAISAAAIAAGTAVIMTPDGNVGIVQSVASNTSLTLTANYAVNEVGVSWTTIGFPQAAYLLTYSNYMFAANTATNPARVYWSNILDPTTWPAANFQDINPNDGFPIVGMFFDGQSLCILKTNSMWKMQGQTFNPTNPTWTVTQVYTPTDFYCNSPRSVQLFGDGFIIYGRNGIYSYNGAGAVSKVFQYDCIRAQWAALTNFNYGNVPDPTAEPTSALVNSSYWVMSPIDNQGFVIDAAGSIWPWAFSNNGVVSDMAYLNGQLYGVNYNTGGTPGLILLSTTSATGYQSDAQTTAINAVYTTRAIEFKNNHRFGQAYIYWKYQASGSFTFSYSIDYGTYTSVTISMSSGTGTSSKSTSIMVGSVGRTIQFKVQNNAAGTTFELYGIEFDHQELRS